MGAVWKSPAWSCLRLCRWLTPACILVVCLCGGLSPRAAAASRLADYNSAAPVAAADIHTLAAALQDAPAPLRADFALAAVSELVEVYRREAERARAEVRRNGADRELLRWSKAVEGLVYDLQRLAERLSSDTPVLVTRVGLDTIYLVVDGTPVLLTGPNNVEDAALEVRVLQRFCSRNDCQDLLQQAEFARPHSAEPEVPPVWRFGDAARPVCATGDGLEFQFEDASDLGAKREACSRIVAELGTLAAALKVETKHGTRLDWNQLAVQSASAAELQQVVLNSDGEYLLMSLPSLESSPELFKLVLPWLAAKVAGQRYNLVVLNTARLLRLPVQPFD